MTAARLRMFAAGVEAVAHIGYRVIGRTKRAVQSAASISSGNHHVEVYPAYEPSWTRQMVDDDIKRRLGCAKNGAGG
jgi:hypothetical protein